MSGRLDVRAMTGNDEETVKEWLRRDRFHQHIGAEAIGAPGTITSLITDADGPVLAFRLSHAVRFDIQINPELESSVRLKKGLVFFTRNLHEAAKQSKAREIVCCPGSQEITKFAEGIGFVGPEQDYILYV